MRGARTSLIALTAVLSLGLAGAAHSDALVLKRDSGARPLTADTPSAGPTAGTTKLGAAGAQKPDLAALPFFNNPSNLPEGFPTESYCAKNPAGGAPNQIKFIIRNQGNAASGNFTWKVIFHKAGVTSEHVQVSLVPGAQKVITQPLPAGCYTQSFSGICEFAINLDTKNEVPETNLSNNQKTGFCVSPAG